MIKAVAIDIDGTITYRDRRLDVAAVGPIREAEAAGLPVILATGNVLGFAEAAAILLGTSGPLIAEDGGIVFDQSTGDEYVLCDQVEARRGLEALERAIGPLRQTRSSAARVAGLTLERTVDVELVNEIFRREGLDLIAVDSGFAIHIKPPGVNKGNALRKAASLLKLATSEIAAIGDGANDVEMLEAAGLSFAPANAHELAKRASTYVSSKPYGEGVREAIEEILKHYR